MSNKRGMNNFFTKWFQQQRGSAMIMVLVSIAFIGILGSILMFTAYMGYQMRLIDKQGKDSFYSAETVLDEINIGIQNKVSQALETAYNEVILNYGLLETAKKRNEKLRISYFDELKKSLSMPHSGGSEYNIELLRSFLSGESKGDGKNGVQPNGRPDSFGTYGAIIESDAVSGTCQMVLEDRGMILKDLRVTYVNPKGYVSIITTDIRLSLPEVTFSQSSEFPDLSHFAMIAEEGFITKHISSGDIIIKGNLYAKDVEIGIPSAMEPLLKGKTYHKPADNATDSMSLMVVKEGLEIGNKGELYTENTELWTDSIKVKNSYLSLDGITNIQNDLLLEGTGSEAIIKGEYYGFGMEKEKAGQSSAIIINGKNSVLDLSMVKRFYVGGRAYIGTGDNQKNDILMGESVAVKSNQLIYLIPPECLGCEIKEGVILNSKYGRNPLTKEQYEEIFIRDSQNFLAINADILVADLGGKPLNQYMKKEKITGSDSLQYVPEVIFKQTNGETLVYCYLRFKDEVAANQYFRDYYGINSEKINNYLNYYAKEITIGNPENMEYIHLAGNGLFYDENHQVYMQSGNDTYSDQMTALEKCAIKQEEFKALTTKLMPNMIGVSEIEHGKAPFENIISQKEVENLLLRFDMDGDGVVTIKTTDDTNSIIITNQNYIVDSTTPRNISLIIGLKNIKIKSSFQGFILAKGEIEVRNEAVTGLEIAPLALEEFTKCLLAKETLDGTDYYIMDLFKDGKNYGFTGQQAMDQGSKKIVISELIIYEHWMKK